MPRVNSTARRLAGAGLATLMGVALVSLVEAGQERQRVQFIQGIVEHVDLEARALMIRPSEGPSPRILYTEETRITGARGGVAGLAVVEGREVIVGFTMQGPSRVASSIELLSRR